MSGKVASPIKILLTILDYQSADKLNKLYTKHELPLHLITHGYGTASSEILNILGLGSSKKNVILSIISEDMLEQTFNILRKEMGFDEKGKGIACVLPVTTISRLLCEIIENEHNLLDIKCASPESEESPVRKPCLYDLIITIVNQSYSEDVMEAAKEAGARGGTLIHARGLGSDEAEKFLGFTIEPEKDIVLNVVKNENKNSIMENISKLAGLKTEGKGVCFSIPVEDQIGIGF